jgi:hypothetical protein
MALFSSSYHFFIKIFGFLYLSWTDSTFLFESGDVASSIFEEEGVARAVAGIAVLQKQVSIWD